MKTGEDILRDVRRLHDDMGFFLTENRAANVDRGFPYPGPAAKKIGEALDALQAQYRALVFAEDECETPAEKNAQSGRT